MKTLDEKSIQYLPFHDSDFLGIKIIQSDEGETDLILNIAFYEGEFESLSEDYLNVIKTDGTASILFKACNRININAVCNRSQRDEIDFINFIQDSPSLKEDQKHVEVIFISGSKLECIAEKVELSTDVHYGKIGGKP